MSPAVVKKSTKIFHSNDDESSDDDFVLDENDGKNDSESNKSIFDANYDSGDEKVINSFKKNQDNDYFFEENNNSGVKTRSQKFLKEKASECTSKAFQIDVNAIWNNMNQKEVVKNVDYSSFDCAEEKVKISRTYEFAGKIEVEDRYVLKDSAEAKAHFSSIDLSQISKPSLKRQTKRVSSLEVANNKAVKLNTLEKSRLDWAKFVDKEGISEELKIASKDGYIDKQLFLQVSQEKMARNIRGKMEK
ncbi:hypothetical protein PORY_000537 [Pneumocystis oryctolagi]|uniref:Uncharacterized protein n=1 Tax=Pneumocystis oryctolagi TaxID=42067 RepID=A0ACB7CFJ6_9ASCO|nr:hypothetical protein PORY_000537 [Pneumocystis oryctolagi]